MYKDKRLMAASEIFFFLFSPIFCWWADVPTLVFDLSPHYGAGSEDNGGYHFNIILHAAAFSPSPHIHSSDLIHHLCQPGHIAGGFRRCYLYHYKTVHQLKSHTLHKREGHSVKHQNNMLTMVEKYQVNEQIPRIPKMSFWRIKE